MVSKDDIQDYFWKKNYQKFVRDNLMSFSLSDE